MKHSYEDQTIALAGVFQSATLVHQMAHHGNCDDLALEALVRSLFVTKPAHTLDVYSDLQDIRLGLEHMANVLQQQSGRQDLEILRYALNLIHLAGQLRQKPGMLNIISNRIEQARHTVQHFGLLHSNTLSNLASIYMDTISTFRLRIQVTGNQDHLQVAQNATRIRALLLSGIRAAILWHQTGGRRWHLILQRKRAIATARRLFESL